VDNNLEGTASKEIAKNQYVRGMDLSRPSFKRRAKGKGPARAVGVFWAMLKRHR